MTVFRLIMGGAGFALVGLPLALPILTALLEPDSWRAWHEGSRLLSLIRTTCTLNGLVLLLTLVPGVVLGFLLFRCDLPFRVWLRGCLLASLFIPLPLLATAWQAVFGSGGWWVAGWWGEPGRAEWTPWGQGLVAAAWIHATAALPWVALLSGLGFLHVERELEEDARTLGSWPWALLRVTLPRAGLAVLAAIVWVVVQTSTEITVTDLFQVRTFAEEIYTQMVVPESGPGDAVRRATLLCLPVVLALGGVAALMVHGLIGRVPARSRWLREPLLVPLGIWRWPALVGVSVLVLGLLLVPLGSLIWRAGSPLTGVWSLEYLQGRFQLLWPSESRLLLVSLAVALVTGGLATTLALGLVVAARGSLGYSIGLLVLAGFAWAMPGPLVGQGYRDLVDLILIATGEPAWLRQWLYDGPSPVPLVAVGVVRFFPCALAILGPAVHAIPRPLLEMARLDGLGPWTLLREVILPLIRGPVVLSVLFVALLSLGELGASKRVSTPDMPSYAEALFTQMHYGIDADLAIRCLLLFTVLLPGVLVLSRVGNWFRGSGPHPQRRFEHPGGEHPLQ